MPLFKKAIVYLSIAALAAPIVASGSVGVASADAAKNVRSTQTAKPNSQLKVPFRNADSIFNLRVDKHQGGYVLVANIAASGNNVIQKGEKLVIHFDKTNIDLNNSAIVNQTGQLPYSVKKDADKGTVTIAFNQNVDSGSYQTAIGIATKNLYTTTALKANFQGAKVAISNNSITSKWQDPAVSTTNSTQQSSSTQSSSQAQTGSSQVSSNSQAVTQAKTTTTTTTTQKTQATTTYVTKAASQAGQTTTPSQRHYTPTYDEAEKAIMNRTTISVAGTINQNDSTQQTTAQANDSTDVKPAATTNSTNQKQANLNSTNNNTTAKTSPSQTSTDQTSAVKANDESLSNGSSQTGAQTNTNETPQPALPDDQSKAAVAEVTPTPVQQTDVQVQASDNATNVIQTPNGKVSDPKQTLNAALAKQSSEPESDQKAYQANPTFENTKNDIINKVPNATKEEQAEIVKVSPWIWHYISNSASQNQVFNFATLLSTGRTAYTTINGLAGDEHSDILSQNMPKLLKAFGANLSANAFDQAVDIDVLLESQLYQDYLAGRYTPDSDKIDASDAWNAINQHITVQKVANDTDTAGAIELPETYYSAKQTLDGQAAAARAQKATDETANLVINSDKQANVATVGNNDQNNNGAGNKLFNQIKQDMGNKMAQASEQDKAEVLGSVPDFLHQISQNISSSDKTGKQFKFLKPTSDGNKYLIKVDARAITGSADKYLVNLPQIFKAFGDSLRKGDFDKAISIQLMLNSQIYQDYKDGKYIPDALKIKTVQQNDKSDLIAAIILAIIAVPVLAVLLPIIALVTAPIWIPIALVVFTVVFAITALPILLLTFGILLSPLILPLALIFTIGAALVGLVINLIPILNLITIPLTIIAVVAGAIVTVLSVIGILLWIPTIIVTALVALAGLVVPVILCVVAVALVALAALVALTIGLLPILIPILALIGLIVAITFSVLGLLLFALGLPALLLLALVAWIIGAGVLTVLIAALPWIIGGFLGTLAGIAFILLVGWPVFALIALVGGVLIFLVLVALMPMFLIIGFLLWFIAFGFMALIFTGLAEIVLNFAILAGLAMMLQFIPGILIALSWPFWVSLVLLISVPIITILLITGLIPVVGWVMGPVTGIAIAIQAVALALAIVIPMAIGIALVTKAIIGFDIVLAAEAVLELLKDKIVTRILKVDLDNRWRIRLHPVGFWTKDEPLALA